MANATYYFDLTPAAAGFGTLTGAWDTTTANWTASSTGASGTNVAYTFDNTDTAQFGATGVSGTTGGTATIATGVTVTLNQVITQNIAALQTIAASGTGTLNLAGTTPTINVGSAGGLTISSPITGTGGFTKAGSGRLAVTNTGNGISGTITNGVDINTGYMAWGGAAQSGNVFPLVTNVVLNGGINAPIIIDSNASYTHPSTFTGAGSLLLSNGAAAGITFTAGALSGITGTGANTTGFGVYTKTGQLSSYVNVNDFPSGRVSWLLGGASPTGVIKFVGTSGVLSTYTTDLYINTVDGGATTGTPVIELYANGSAGSAFKLTGPVTRTGTNLAAATLAIRGTNTDNNELSGIISDFSGSFTLAITKADSGTWVLSGTNTYTGNTRPVAGTLKITNALALQNSPLDLISTDTGTVDFGILTAATLGGFTTSSGSARNYAIPANVTLTIKPVTGATHTYAGTLSANAGASFVKAGPGTQVMTGTNTLTNAITVTAGTLTAGANGTTGDFGTATGIAISSGATASVNRSNASSYAGTITGAGTFSTVTGAGTLTLSNSTISVTTLTHGAGTIVFPTAGQTVSSAIGGAGAITFSAPGTVTLSGGGANTGAWAVNNGATLAVTTAALTGTTGTITVASGGTLTSTAAISKPVTINSGSTGNNFVLGGTSAALTINGAATISGTAGTLTTGTSSVVVSSASTTTQSIKGTVTLNNSSNTGGADVGLSGTTILTLNSATISSANNQANGNATLPTVVINNGGTFSSTIVNSSGQGLHFGGFSGSYVYCKATNGGTFHATSFLDFGCNSVSSAPYPGGTCVVDIDGGAVSQTGATGGIFVGSYTNTAGSHAAILNIISGASSSGALFVNQAKSDKHQICNVTGIGTLITCSNIEVAAGDVNALSALYISDGGKVAAVNFNAVVNANYKQVVGLWGGILSVTGSVLTGLPIRLHRHATLANKLSGSTVATGVINSNITEATGYGVAAIPLTFNGAGYIGAPAIKIKGGSGTGAAARAVFDSTTGTITSIVITNPGTGYALSDSLTLEALYGGATSPITFGTPTLSVNTAGVGLEKVDSGTLTLTGTNINTGTYTVSNGVLRIGNAGAAGTLGNNDASNADVASGATLNFNRSDSRTYSGTISGAGNISKTTAGGTAILTGDNSFQGTASITTGTLVAAHSNALGTGTTLGVTVSNGAALHLSSGITTVAKPLTLNGTGVTTTGALRNLSGNNTYAGPIALTLATRINSDADTLTLSNTTAISNATIGLTFGGAGNVALAAPIQTTSGTVAKDGAGTARLSATTSNYTGTTTVTAGTLEFASIANVSGGASSLGAPTTVANGTVALSSGATLRFIGSGTSSTNRVINLVGGAGSTFGIESSGTAAVTYATAFTHGTSAVTRTLALGGSGTASNKLSFIIANNGAGGTVSISKSGSGKWVLNSANTFTGNVTISDGTLVAESEDASKRFGLTNLVTTSSTGKIQTLKGTNQNGRHTYNNLTLNGGRIRIGG